MRRPDRVWMEWSRRLPATLLMLALSGGALLLAATPALGQTDYTGVAPPPTLPPPPPTEDTYVSPYLGGVTPAIPGIGLSAAAPLNSGASVSLETQALGEPPEVPNRGRGGLITGWDLFAAAGLGLTAVAAVAVSAGRFRSR